MTKTYLLAGSAAVAFTILAAPALAQEGGEPEAESRQSVITVTARKTEESIQDIPISVSAIGADAISEQAITNISELSDFVPGFQQQQAFGRDGDRPVIRGTSNILISEGKVGVFIDGVPFFGDSSSLDLTSFERVEIIKGPQSAVFGRGTLSGAINYVTRKPGDEAFSGQVSGEFGEHGYGQGAGFVNFRANDMLAFSANAKVSTFDGDYENSLGGDLNGRETTTFGGAVFFDPFEDLSISARYIYAEDEDTHFAIALTDPADNNCYTDTRGYFCGTLSAPDEYALNTNNVLMPGLYRESDRGFLSADWDIMGSGYSLTYQAGITDIYERSGTDQTYDGNEAFFIGPSCVFFITNCDAASSFNGTGASQRTAFTNEIRLASPSTADFRWRVGAYTSREQRKPLAEYIEFTEFGPDSLGDITEIDNVAYFGGVEYDINDKLTIGFEIRRAEDDITTTGQQYVLSQFVDPSVVAELPAFIKNPNQVVGTTEVREATFESTAPRFTIDYRIDNDAMIYGQYAEGNSPGGFNGIDAPQTTYDEEELKSFEVGTKTSKFGFDRLNVSAFFNKFENQVLTNTYMTGSGGVDSYRANIGQTEIFGIEVEFVKAVTDNMVVYGSYGYLDAEITEGVDRDHAILLAGAACSDLAAAGCAAAGDISGKTPPLVSDHQAAIGTRYDFDIGSGEVDYYVGGDVTYRSSFFAQVHNEAETGDATRVNLRAGADFGNISFQVWGKNVFEDDTVSGILRYVDFNAPASPAGSTRAFGLTPSPAAQWGATATVRF